MRVGLNNYISAPRGADDGLDLRAWESGWFDWDSEFAPDDYYIEDTSVEYNSSGDPKTLYIQYSDGSEQVVYLRAKNDGVYADDSITYEGEDVSLYVDYANSYAPGNVPVDLSENRPYFTWNEIDAIASGDKWPLLSLFSLAGHDEIWGSNHADYIVGAGGGDLLHGKDGNDRIWGGSGADQIFGEDGLDRIWGDGGHDQLGGGAGRDLIFAGTGNDTVSGGSGNDHLSGDAGNDDLFGDTGNDDLFGSGGNDALSGNSGSDYIQGDAGRDTIRAGSGSDILDGGSGNDDLWGCSGADRFVFGRNDGDDIVADFDARYDEIKIESGAQRFRDLDIARDGSDTLIEFANVEIVLEDVRPSELDADNFIF